MGKFSAGEARDRVTRGLRCAFNGILYVLLYVLTTGCAWGPHKSEINDSQIA